MKTFAFAAIAAGMLLCSSSAIAEPYVDYTPQKGLWHVTTIKVDPNHIDDYVTGLKREWAPGEDVAKRNGVIDSYQIMVKMNPSGDGGNVLLIEHLPSAAMLDPNQTRDQKIQRESYAVVPKATSEAKVKEFEKYRSFVSDDYYGELAYTK